MGSRPPPPSAPQSISGPESHSSDLALPGDGDDDDDNDDDDDDYGNDYDDEHDDGDNLPFLLPVLKLRVCLCRSAFLDFDVAGLDLVLGGREELSKDSLGRWSRVGG